MSFSDAFPTLYITHLIPTIKPVVLSVKRREKRLFGWNVFLMGLVIPTSAA